MDDKVLIARRVASELKDGSLVNLGIGLPTMVPMYLPPGIEVYFQSENGIIGMAPMPGSGMEEPSLTDAGGSFVGAIPGAILSSPETKGNAGQQTQTGIDLMAQWRFQIGADWTGDLWGNASWVDGEIDEGNGVDWNLSHVSAYKLKLGATLRQLRWKLTLSYTTVTVGTLLIVLLLLAFLLLPQVMAPASAMGDWFTTRRAAELVTARSGDPSRLRSAARTPTGEPATARAFSALRYWSRISFLDWFNTSGCKFESISHRILLISSSTVR